MAVVLFHQNCVSWWRRHRLFAHNRSEICGAVVRDGVGEPYRLLKFIWMIRETEITENVRSLSFSKSQRSFCRFLIILILKIAISKQNTLFFTTPSPILHSSQLSPVDSNPWVPQFHQSKVFWLLPRGLFHFHSFRESHYHFCCCHSRKNPYHRAMNYSIGFSRRFLVRIGVGGDGGGWEEEETPCFLHFFTLFFQSIFAVRCAGRHGLSTRGSPTNIHH